MSVYRVHLISSCIVENRVIGYLKNATSCILVQYVPNEHGDSICKT